VRSLTSIYSYIQRWKVNLRLVDRREGFPAVDLPTVSFFSNFLFFFDKKFAKKIYGKTWRDRKIFKENLE